MTWKFDPILEDLVWVQSLGSIEDGAIISFGDEIDSDLAVDMGDRTNDSSEIDQGPRIFEV